MPLDKNQHRSPESGPHAANVLPFSRSGAWSALERAESLEKAYRKHQTIYNAGDVAGQIFEVRRGSLFIYIMTDDGRRQIVDLVHTGDFFGYAEGAVHRSSAEAFEATSIAVFDRAAIFLAPEVQRRAMQQIGRRVSALQDHALCLGRKTAAERVAWLLLKFSAREGLSRSASSEDESGESSIAMPMTRAEIADYLGLSLETVSRVLSELERRHYIEIGIRRGRILIKSISRLHRIAKSEFRECVDERR